MLVALSFVTSMLPSLPGPITKFSGFPLLLGGLLVGPRTGFAVGCVADLLGFMVRPTGPFFPGFTITQGLTALIPALFTRKVNPLTWQRNDHDGETPSNGGIVMAYLRLVAIFGVTQLVTSVVLVSIFTSQIVMGTPLILELGNRLFAQITHVPVYAFMALAVLRTLAETDLFERLLKARK